MTVKLAPSILTADFTRLGAEVAAVESAGVDRIHVDVMDGHFVPNLTIGPLVVRALRGATRLPLDVHLMVEQPERLLSAFVEAGANSVTVHVETCPHLHRTIQNIKELGARAGVAINPATPLVALEEILLDTDIVLLMSVNPGFGGQSYISWSTGKLQRLHDMVLALPLRREETPPVEIAVDGGIKPENAAEVVSAGAEVLVVGSAIFNQRASVEANVSAFFAATAHL